MDDDQKREIIDKLEKAGIPYSEASDFVQDPQRAIQKMDRQIIHMLVNRLLILEQSVQQQQKQIGDLSAKVWRLQNR